MNKREVNLVKLTKMQALITRVHRGDVYGEVFDYAAHLYCAYAKGVEAGCTNFDVLLALLGHDLVEKDPTLSFRTLRQCFSETTARIIFNVTRTDEPYMEYIARICEDGCSGTIFVKAVDIATNISTLRDCNVNSQPGTRPLRQRYTRAIDYMRKAVCAKYGIPGVVSLKKWLQFLAEEVNLNTIEELNTGNTNENIS